MGAVDVGVNHRLAMHLGDLECQLEQVLEAQLVVVGGYQARQVLLGFLVLVVLLGALAEVKHRQRLAFFIMTVTTGCPSLMAKTWPRSTSIAMASKPSAKCPAHGTNAQHP